MSRTTIPDLSEKYAGGTPLSMLTAYDAPIARQVDRAGVDMILVGDSAGDNHLGYDDTLPVTMEEALSNTGAVVRGTREAFIVADMPFLSYGTSLSESVENAGRFLKEADADAVKLETAPYGEATIEIVDRCTELGIPVQGHVGLTPQRANQIGGAYVQGRDPEFRTAVDYLDRGLAVGRSLQFYRVGAGLLEEAAGVLDGLRKRGAIREEGHVGDGEGLLGAADDGGGVRERLVHRDRDGVVVAEVVVAGAVADEDHVDARPVDLSRDGRVVGRQHRERHAIGVLLGEVGDGRARHRDTDATTGTGLCVGGSAVQPPMVRL